MGDGDTVRMQRRAGDCPVMVGSKRCHLHGHSPAQLCRGREESGEMGGYFIVRGIERVIRLLQVGGGRLGVGLRLRLRWGGGGVGWGEVGWRRGWERGGVGCAGGMGGGVG